MARIGTGLRENRPVPATKTDIASPSKSTIRTRKSSPLTSREMDSGLDGLLDHDPRSLFQSDMVEDAELKT